jgi:hypothetical protein
MLKMADARVPVNEMWRKHGISSSNGSQRTAKYGRLDASELKSAKELDTGVPD